MSRPPEGEKVAAGPTDPDAHPGWKEGGRRADAPGAHDEPGPLWIGEDEPRWTRE